MHINWIIALDIASTDAGSRQADVDGQAQILKPVGARYDLVAVGVADDSRIAIG